MEGRSDCNKELHKTCDVGDTQKVWHLLQEDDIDLGTRDPRRNGMTCLIKAAVQNQVDIVIMLLLSGKLGNSAYCQDSQGFNAFHWALILGYIDIISVMSFLDETYLHECDKYGRSPTEIFLHVKKHPQVCKMLVTSALEFADCSKHA
jgi:hypothetical protein